MPFDKFPYTNFHELNLDYFIQHFKQIFAEWAELYQTMLAWKEQTMQDLEAWKTETGEDIEAWEQDVLDNLEEWKTAFQELFDETFSNLEDIKSAAEDARDAAEGFADDAQGYAEDAEQTAQELSDLADNAFVRLTAEQESTIAASTNTEKLTAMPAGTYDVWGGADLSNLVSESFPKTLTSTGRYVVKCYGTPYNTKFVSVESRTGNILCYGYTLTAHPDTFTWSDASFSTVEAEIDALENAYTALSSDAFTRLTAVQLATISASANTEKLTAMPGGTYYTFDGNSLSALVSASFPFTITSAGYYTVKCFTTNASVGTKYVSVEARNGAKLAYGFTLTTHLDTFAWADRSWNDSVQETPTVLAKHMQDTSPVFELYTEYETYEGWWKNDGTVSTSNTYPRSELLPIRGDTDYYLGYAPGNNVVGVYFDKAGNYIGYIFGSAQGYPTRDVAVVSPSYDGGDDTYIVDQADTTALGRSLYPTTSFAKLYRIHSPANAAYISLNCPTTWTSGHKCFIASKDMYVVRDSGNVVLYANDPVYRKYKGKKLCMIGPSTYMINRLYETGKDVEITSDTEKAALGMESTDTVYHAHVVSDTVRNGYVMGLQEYLKPYFDTVKAFGYSGASYAYGRGAVTHVPSIYTQICGGTETYTRDGVEYSVTISDTPDLSGYDIFILPSNGNGLSSDTLGSITDAVNTTYLGAINLLCSAIKTQNPRAKIYLGMSSVTTMAAGTARTLRETLNTNIRQIAERDGYGIMPVADMPTQNTDNKNLYRYDGTHSNVDGNFESGMMYRRTLLGF